MNAFSLLSLLRSCPAEQCLEERRWPQSKADEMLAACTAWGDAEARHKPARACLAAAHRREGSCDAWRVSSALYPKAFWVGVPSQGCGLA